MDKGFLMSFSVEIFAEGPQVPPRIAFKLVNTKSEAGDLEFPQSRGPQMLTPKYYSPYYRDPQNGASDFGKASICSGSADSALRGGAAHAGQEPSSCQGKELGVTFGVHLPNASVGSRNRTIVLKHCPTWSRDSRGHLAFLHLLRSVVLLFNISTIWDKKIRLQRRGRQITSGTRVPFFVKRIFIKTS